MIGVLAPLGHRGSYVEWRTAFHSVVVGHCCRDVISRSATALLLTAALGGVASADQSWSYTIGETWIDQQANFCASRAESLRIAEVFEERGARAGFSALDESIECRLRVETFMPEALLREVVISQGEPGEYTVRFVRVRLDGGETRFLVTTRAVRIAN